MQQIAKSLLYRFSLLEIYVAKGMDHIKQYS